MATRKNDHPFDAASVLQGASGTLAQLATKTNFLSQLQNIVRQTCPDLPAQVWQIGNFRQNTCIIRVTSPIWAQRLQFERMNICKQLQELTQGQFSQIEITISPLDLTSNKPRKIESNTLTKKHMSSNTAQHLLDVAQNAPESLKKKLTRLASLAEKK